MQSRCYLFPYRVLQFLRKEATRRLQLRVTKPGGSATPPQDGCRSVRPVEAVVLPRFSRDVAVIRVAIKDAKGRVVPTANNLVQFSIEGPGKIVGTGNGNPSSHEPDKASQRMAFNGYCLVIVEAGKQAGEIRLKASSEKLKDNEILINVK
jgi:hypothetical protein